MMMIGDRYYSGLQAAVEQPVDSVCGGCVGLG